MVASGHLENVLGPPPAPATRALSILTFTSLYPNAARPYHGIFVEQRLRKVVETGAVTARVVAPVPWFPWRHTSFGRYALHARAPSHEERHGISVVHPRFPVIPKVGESLAPFLMARWLLPVLRRFIRDGYDFDLLDGHFLYPDGVAAVMLARSLGKPVVVTARGSDVNIVARHRLPRRMIRWAVERAGGVVTVSRALKDSLVALGAPEPRITVLRNGVDLQAFAPVDRAAARQRLGLTRSTLVSVGNLVPVKGHDIFLRALALLPEADGLIIGDGVEAGSLRSLARRLKILERLRFVSRVSPDELTMYYTATDVLVLASSHEGWPNVLLEAMACGTPVVATRVGGIPEIVQAPEAGKLVEERTPEAVAVAVRALLSAESNRQATRHYAERYDWGETTRGQLALFRRLVAEHRDSGSRASAAPRHF